MRRGDRRRNIGGLLRRHGVQQTERVTVAAIANDGYGRDLIGVACAIVREGDGGARLVHSFLDTRIGFGGQRLFQRRQGILIARFEHGLRRIITAVGVARHQGEATDGCVDNAA